MSATPCVRIRRNRPWRNPRTSDPRSWPHTAEPSPRPMFSVRSVGDHQEPGRIVNRETRAYFGWGRTDAVAGANRALPKSRQNRRQKTGRLARPSILGLAVAAKPPRTPYSWCKIVLRLESYHHHRHQTGAHSAPSSIPRRSIRCLDGFHRCIQQTRRQSRSPRQLRCHRCHRQKGYPKSHALRNSADDFVPLGTSPCASHHLHIVYSSHFPF